MPSKSTNMNTKLVLRIANGVIRFFLNVLFYVLVIMFVVNFSKFAYNFSYQIFGEVTIDSEPGRDVAIQIKKGESTKNIASKLEINKVIVNKTSFYVKAKLEKAVIMPGTYEVNSSMTYEEILSVITDLKKSTTKEKAKK